MIDVRHAFADYTVTMHSNLYKSIYALIFGCNTLVFYAYRDMNQRIAPFPFIRGSSYRNLSIVIKRAEELVQYLSIPRLGHTTEEDIYSVVTALCNSRDIVKRKVFTSNNAVKTLIGYWLPYAAWSMIHQFCRCGAVGNPHMIMCFYNVYNDNLMSVLGWCHHGSIMNTGLSIMSKAVSFCGGELFGQYNPIIQQLFVIKWRLTRPFERLRLWGGKAEVKERLKVYCILNNINYDDEKISAAGYKFASMVIMHDNVADYWSTISFKAGQDHGKPGYIIACTEQFCDIVMHFDVWNDISNIPVARRSLQNISKWPYNLRVVQREDGNIQIRDRWR